MYTSVLVPVDPAEPDFANSALAKASQFVTEYGAVLRLVSVVSPIQGYMTEYLDADFDSRILADARAQLQKIASDLDLPSDKVSVSVRAGGVYHEVLEEARGFNADLVVIASHNPGIATYVIGSNASNIVRHADCSVLVVRD